MDPASVLAAVKVGADVFSAFGASKGQDKANRDQMAFNAMEAQKARDFEERMFSTRYQVTRKDLEAAGYNPLMALGLNPPVPSSPAASASPRNDRAQMAAILSQSARSAADIMYTRQLAKTEESKQLLNYAQASGKIGIPGVFQMPLHGAKQAASQFFKKNTEDSDKKLKEIVERNRKWEQQLSK